MRCDAREEAGTECLHVGIVVVLSTAERQYLISRKLDFDATH